MGEEIIGSTLPPTMWQYSVKLETTQKGTNTEVGVRGNNLKKCFDEAFELLRLSRQKLETAGLNPTPLEVAKE